jgi:uncharacterized hydrophobic protein (TIGR00271 family)
MANHNNHEENILKVKVSDQYKTVDELMKKSRPGSIYYTLLTLSTFIVASGLLLDNAFIIIGGMLVTPVLSPLLVLALGLAIGEPNAIKNEIVLILKSFLLIILGSLFLALIFGTPGLPDILDNTVRTATLYFIVALAAGTAATFAWARREIAEILTGIAIAVSLVPPLSLIGLALASLNLETARFYFMISLFNLLGVIVGSLIVFSLLKFHKTEKKVEREAKAVAAEAKQNKE